MNYSAITGQPISVQHESDLAEFRDFVGAPRYGFHLPVDADFVKFSEELDGWIIDLTDGRCWSVFGDIPREGCDCGDVGAHELLSFGQDGFSGLAIYRVYCHATKRAWDTFEREQGTWR